MILRVLILCSLGLAHLMVSASPELNKLWQERVKSVVAVEFFTDTELDRRPSQTFGTVIDDEGTIIFPSQVLNNRVSVDQLKDFRVYLPGGSTTHYFKARYLGHDEFTGWEFVRVEDKAALASLVPITSYTVAPTPEVAEEIWGIGLKKKDENFVPYFMSSRVSILQRLPQLTALAAQEVAGMGLPVFDKDGAFVGLTIGGFGETFLQFSGRDRGGLPVVMINPDECAAVVLSGEILPHLRRIPTDVDGRPLAWLGANGLQPLDPEVASYLKIEKQAGLVVSEVLENSPAELAGLKERDIILAVNGEPLPVLKPDSVLVTYFQREVDRRFPGDVMELGVLRGNDRLALKAKLTDAPELPREAPRRYFERLGLTIRGFTFADAVVRRVKSADQSGVVAHFVKPNAPTGTAGLRMDDWIKEIDGSPVKTFAEAAEKLAVIDSDILRSEFVLLVDRGSETAVLRVKLK